MTDVIMCCTDGDEPFGVCTREAVTLRPAAYPGPEPAPPDAPLEPYCQTCADNFDAWSRMQYIKAQIVYLRIIDNEYPHLVQSRILTLQEEYDTLSAKHPA